MHAVSDLTGPPPPQGDNATIPVFTKWLGSWQFSLRRQAFAATQLVGFYDRAAPEWRQTVNRLGFPAAYENLLRRILSEEISKAARAPLHVLDCGIGTGAFSGALARVLPAPFELDGIDISPRMLEKAEEALRPQGLRPILRQGDVNALPYGDGMFDLVIAAHLLEHQSDPGRALNEMVRVLKPGGRLITCLTRRTFLGMYVHLKWRTHRLTPDQAKTWLRQSGLDNAHCLWFGGNAICRRLSLACVGQKPLEKGHA